MNPSAGRVVFGICLAAALASLVGLLLLLGRQAEPRPCCVPAAPAPSPSRPAAAPEHVARKAPIPEYAPPAPIPEPITAGTAPVRTPEEELALYFLS
jgi:hypothetical protein